MVLDNEGEKRVLEVDKYVIMYCVGIYVCDFWILDLFLLYLFMILGCEWVIVFNFEVRIVCVFFFLVIIY